MTVRPLVLRDGELRLADADDVLVTDDDPSLASVGSLSVATSTFAVPLPTILLV